MQGTDAAVLDALRTSHQPIARLLSLDSIGLVRASWQGRTGSARSILTAGTVSFDRTASVRRTCQLSLANPTGSLSPQQPGDWFFTGERIAVQRGLRMAGQDIYLPMMTGVVTGYDADMAGTLSVTGEDPLGLAAQPFGDVATVSAGMAASDAVVALLGPVLGDTSGWLLDDGGQTCPDRAWLSSDERLYSVWQLMADLGLELFCDRTGNVVLRPIPDLTAQAAVRSFDSGSADASMLTWQRSGSRWTYNRVVVLVNREDGTIIRAQADVTDPSSPIHADRIGLRVAPVIENDQIPDQAAANAVANAALVEYSLYADSGSGSAVPDPTLDEEDIISVTDAVSGTNGLYVVDQVQHPVLAGSMTLTSSKSIPVQA